MDIKLKNKLLNNSWLWDFLERFVLILFIAIMIFSLIINSNMSSIKLKKQDIRSVENSLIETNSKIHTIENYENTQVDIDWINFNAWIINCAAPSNLCVYQNTNNLRILSEKPQEELDKLSKSFKLTTNGNDYNRLVKFIIIDKSKLTFITNDVDNMDFIKKNLKAFSQEDGQFYNYISSKGKWYNLSYDSASAPAHNYDNNTNVILHNPTNFVEAYWFSKDYIYSKEDKALLEKLLKESKEVSISQVKSLKMDITRMNNEITKAKIVIVVCSIFIFIILVALYFLGKTRIIRGLKNNFMYKLGKFIDNKFQNKGIIFKVTFYFLFTMFTFFIGFISLFALNSSIIVLLILFIPWTFIYFIFILPRMIKFLKYLNNIIKGSDNITSGNLDYIIPEKGDESLKRLAHNINKINKGFKVSIEDKIKNERLKSQLVANVSHDLKTPLTSIINSTDILLREDISVEEREEYLKILHRKSLKLKKLIEDLFQISKINSGKVELNKENVDVLELVNQSIAEYSDTDIYNNKNLTFIIRPFKENIEMNLDGNKMSRVFENIINNTLKYSLKNTRVYVDIEALNIPGARTSNIDNSHSEPSNTTIIDTDDNINNNVNYNNNTANNYNNINNPNASNNADDFHSNENTRNNSNVTDGIKITFKNISSAALDFDKEEIFERFTRGDESRNSHIDGNGLGLAIAKSIVELHGGKMYVDFDGDLFKSIIELY